MHGYLFVIDVEFLIQIKVEIFVFKETENLCHTFGLVIVKNFGQNKICFL